MKLFFRELGDGKPLIILHGLYGMSDNWMHYARALTDCCRVIVPDLRNHGNSPHSDDHSYSSMSQDLFELMNHLSISKATLLGHSMGGKAAMHFAALHPERVSALIVADIAPKNYLDLFQFGAHKQNHPSILAALSSIGIEKISSRKEADRLLAQKIPSLILRQFLLKNLRRKSNHEFEWKINVPVLLNCIDAILRDVNYEWLEREMHQSDFPATFIYGGKSDYLQIEDHYKISLIYPQSSFIEIPDAGHWLHADRPEMFLDAIFSVIK